MELVTFVGWVAALASAVSSLPQLIRLIRAGTSAGISLLNWQLLVANFLGWVYHGLRIGATSLWLTNGILLVCAVLIVIMVIRDRHLNPITTWILGVVLGAACASVDFCFGSMAFGVVILFPQGFGAIAQLIEVIRRIDLRGVSGLFLFNAFFTQTLWFWWALLYGDPAVRIAATVQGSIALVSFLWWVARMRGFAARWPDRNE